MATKIVTKNSSTAGAAPTATDLVQGELAVNVADGRLYTENASAAIVELGVNPAAEIQANAGVAFPDNQKATFGTGGDLEIYHNANTSFITESGSSNFKIGGENLYLQNTAHNENYLAAIANGGVTLYYNNVAKLATTSTGIDVTGTVTSDGLVVNGVGSITALSDNAVLNVNVSGGTSKTSTINQRAKSSNGSNAETAIVTTGSGGEAVGSWDFKLDTAAGALKTAMRISEGDISFYEDTGTTPKFFWDASAESLGIGTSAPSVYGVDGAEDLVIGQADGDHGLTISSFGSSNGTIAFSDQTNVSVGRGYLDYDHNVNAMTIGTNGTERMRIDASGNLLVGTTSTDPAASSTETGVALKSGGFVSISRNDSAASVNINKIGFDGSLVDFRKDGSSVGSIGSISSDLFIAEGNSGWRFDGENNQVLPCSTTASTDGTLSIGGAGARVGSIFMGGGLYLGGTGAANKLDDYEEGTWTLGMSTSNNNATLSMSNTTGSYTKVGRKVTCTIYTGGINISAIGTGAVELTGLPFACSGGNKSYACPTFGHTNCFAYDAQGYVAIGQTHIVVTRTSSVEQNAFVQSATKYMMFTITYFTDS